MTRDDESPRDLLDMAGVLLRRADPASAGLWPRAAAILACQALEASVARLWDTRTLDLQTCSIRGQLICLRTYLGDADLAARTGHAWSALSRSCHHHPYELAPTTDELRGWLSVVGELIQEVEATGNSQSKHPD